MNNYFNEKMFNSQYVNSTYYNQIKQQLDNYNYSQDLEVQKALKAMNDLCDAVNNLDSNHQQKAFELCLATIAKKMHW